MAGIEVKYLHGAEKSYVRGRLTEAVSEINDPNKCGNHSVSMFSTDSGRKKKNRIQGRSINGNSICDGLDRKHLSQNHVLSAWSPACGVLGGRA